MWTGKLIRLVGRYDFSPLCMFKRSPISLQRTGKLIRLVGRKTNWCLLLWHESHKNQLIFESKHREKCFKIIEEDRSWDNTFLTITFLIYPETVVYREFLGWMLLKYLFIAPPTIKTVSDITLQNLCKFIQNNIHFTLLWKAWRMRWDLFPKFYRTWWIWWLQYELK